MLFDEIEKAHNDVFNILLQVLDEGHLTDGLGNNVNFKNTIVILTSNLGSEYFSQATDRNLVRDQVMNVVKMSFRPELLNRLDEILVFNSLSKDNMKGIVDIQLRDLKKRLDDKNIELTIDDSFKNWICEEGYDPLYGARPLKRALQKNLYDVIARMIISGDVREGSKYTVKYSNDSVEIC